MSTAAMLLRPTRHQCPFRPVDTWKKIDETRIVSMGELYSWSYPVGGFNPSEKKLVSWDDYSQYMEK